LSAPAFALDPAAPEKERNERIHHCKRQLGLGLLGASICLAAQEARPSRRKRSPWSQPRRKRRNPPSRGAPGHVDPKSFLLGPEDVILVRVCVSRTCRTTVIRPDGQINMPLIREYELGPESEQLTTNLTEALSKFIQSPGSGAGHGGAQPEIHGHRGNQPAGGLSLAGRPRIRGDHAGGGFREFANTGNITILRGAQRLRFNYRKSSKAEPGPEHPDRERRQKSSSDDGERGSDSDRYRASPLAARSGALGEGRLCNRRKPS